MHLTKLMYKFIVISIIGVLASGFCLADIRSDKSTLDGSIITAVTGSDTVNGIMIETVFNELYHTEPLSIKITNNNETTFCLNDSSPWVIVANDSIIYAPDNIPTLACMLPGETLSWSWHQKDQNNKYVIPGSYIVGIPSWLLNSNTHLLTHFSITETLGSAGYFTISIPPESMRIFMEEPIAIRAAILNYYGENMSSIPMGAIIDDRPGGSPYDNQWSWHLDPSSIGMYEITAEYCDGLPSYIESDLDLWSNEIKDFCPWGATITQLN